MEICRETHEDDIDKLLEQVLPQDLVKYGLIPELVGRVPVVVSLKCWIRKP